MKIAVRTDASSRIASGHVMRCKTLADELRGHGAEVRFVCREAAGNLIPLLVGAGYPTSALPRAEDTDQSKDADETTAALDGFRPDWLVVDHYGLDRQWESRLRPHVDHILVIDDLANRPHECDVLLDQNWFGESTQFRYRGLADQAMCLLGPQYALLQPAFSQIRRTLPVRSGVIRRLLMFFGGVDASNQTATALQALLSPEAQDLEVDVVVGHAHPEAAAIERLARSRPRTTLHRSVPTLADLMASADLMLGAGGATTLERCCLGLPAIVVIAGENQRAPTRALADGGVHYLLGDASAVTAAEWSGALGDLRGAPERVRRYSAAARAVTDGGGAPRAAAVLMGR